MRCPPRADVGYFTARLTGPSLTAVVEVYDLEVEHWPRFLQGLAESWKGWDGCREVESLEGHLRLGATSDRLGHVSIQVRLASAVGKGWSAEAVLELEAGSLDEVARSARQFFDRGAA